MLTDTKIAAIKAPKTGQVEHPDAKVTGLRIRVGATGKKTWTLRKRVGAKTLNRKLGTYPAMSLAQARDTALAMLEALERSGNTDALDRTFGEVAALWVEKKAKLHNKAWRKQQQQLEFHVLPHWRDIPIRSLSFQDVADLIDRIEGKVVPNRVLALVKAILNWATERERRFIEHSPADGFKMPKKEKSRKRFLSMDEVVRLWTATDLMGFPFGHWIKCIALTGQRPGEVASMCWQDIDLDGATWTVSDTKNDVPNVVPLSKPVVQMLRSFPVLGDFVFTTTGETPISGFSKAKSRIDQFLTASGDPLEDWVFHDLRRTASTHMVRLGVSMEIVGLIDNHKPQGITAKIYALHDRVNDKRDALDKWAAEIDRAVNGERGGNVVKLERG